MNGSRTDVPEQFKTVARLAPASGGISNIIAVQARWGG